MSKQIEEQISEFMDGELLKADHDRIIRRICEDKDLKDCWQRYQLISDAMKNNMPAAIDDRFAQSVMNALENEPTILAPKSIAHKSAIKRKITGVAIAASVAAVAVIGVQTMNQTNELAPSLAEMPSSDQYVRMPQSSSSPQPTSQATYSNRATIAAVPALKASTQQNSVNSQHKPKVTSLYQYHPQLQKYLLNHNQYTSGSHIQGVMPYARIVVTPTKQKNNQGQ